MSLDVYLTSESPVETKPGIFIRENGSIVEISRLEWDERFPNREPVMVKLVATNEGFSANITHNLHQMATAAGLFCIWHPEDSGAEKAGQLIEPMEKGLALLKSDPERFRQFDADNGWGTYEQFVPWVERYLAACKEYPDARVRVSR